MPKKTKRKVTTVIQPAPAPEVMEVQAVATNGAATSSPSQAARPTSFSRRPSAQDFNPDYSYVIKDLKRIGTLAGTFFVILIILTFIIR